MGRLRAGLAGGRACACGASVPNCPFWSAIRERLVGRLGTSVIEEGASLKRLERARNLPRVLAGQSLPGSGRWGLIEHTLLAAIREVADRPIVLDSTKQPIRGAMLSSYAGQRVHPIHLVRDPRAVAWSVTHGRVPDRSRGIPRGMPAMTLPRFAAEWLVTNLASEAAVAWTGGPRIRHEDFLADTVRTASRILEALGLPTEPLLPVLRAERPARPTHQVAGNPMRTQRTVTLRRDRTWWEESTPWWRGAVWCATAPLAFRYGYPPRAEAVPSQNG